MDNQNTQQASDQTPQTEQKNTPVTPSVTEKEIEGKTPQEIVQLLSSKSEEYGKLQAEVKRLKQYEDDTILAVQTIVTDPDLLKSVSESYQKRFVQPQEPQVNTQIPQNQDQPQPNTNVPQQDNTEVKKTLVNQIIDNFEKSKGLDRLTGDAKKEMQNRIGQYVFNMADSFLGAGKTYQQIIDSVPLDKLNAVFENAYTFATSEEKIQRAKEEGTAEAQATSSGIIGSLPSSSPNTEQITLSAEERAQAKKMNVTDEKYLQRKKEIDERNKKPEAIW